MARPTHFGITGVDDASARNVSIVVEADSIEAARLKAAQAGITTARVEPINPRTGVAMVPARVPAAIAWALLAFSTLGTLGMWSLRPRAPQVESVLSGDTDELGYVIGMVIGGNLFNLVALIFALRVRSARRDTGGGGCILLWCVLISIGLATLVLFAPRPARARVDGHRLDATRLAQYPQGVPRLAQ